MEEINTLLNTGATLEQRTIAANTIITNYNLHFTTNDIVKAFNNAGNYFSCSISIATQLSLTINLRLFIAIVYALIDDKSMIGHWYIYLYFKDKGNLDILGCNWAFTSIALERATKVWCALYDYYEFDISELPLTDELREHIQKHIDSKVTYVKRAIK